MEFALYFLAFTIFWCAHVIAGSIRDAGSQLAQALHDADAVDAEYEPVGGVDVTA